MTTTEQKRRPYPIPSTGSDHYDTSHISIKGITAFKIKAIKKTLYKEGHYIIIKRSIQEKILHLSIYMHPIIGTPQYIKQIIPDIKEEIDRNTILVGDFNTLFISKDRSSRQKINKRDPKWVWVDSGSW